jgi:hypothetical protein
MRQGKQRLLFASTADFGVPQVRELTPDYPIKLNSRVSLRLCRHALSIQALDTRVTHFAKTPPPVEQASEHRRS